MYYKKQYISTISAETLWKMYLGHISAYKLENETHWSVIISFTIRIYLPWIADQINDSNHLPLLLMRLEKESAMTAFLISLFQTLQSIFKYLPASVASVSPCAIIYFKSRSRSHKRWWELGEHPYLPPPIPEVGGGGGYFKWLVHNVTEHVAAKRPPKMASKMHK